VYDVARFSTTQFNLNNISSFTIGNKNGTAKGKTRSNVKIPQLFMKIIHLKLLKRVSTILCMQLIFTIHNIEFQTQREITRAVRNLIYSFIDK
jgi:hypothetical protein